MTNKLTVLGLVAATAFIFTSCTKDDETSLNDRLIAPVATLEAPTVDDATTVKSGNEYQEADNGQSIPGIETAPVSDPVSTPPTHNNTNRDSDYYMGVKNVPTPTPIPPAGVQEDAVRYQSYFTGVKEVPTPSQVTPASYANAQRIDGYKNPYPDSPMPNEPNVLPFGYMNPKGVSNNAGRTYYISNQNPNDPLPSEPNVVPHTFNNPTGVSNSTDRYVNAGELPDCTFPVISTQNAGQLDL